MLGGLLTAGRTVDSERELPTGPFCVTRPDPTQPMGQPNPWTTLQWTPAGVDGGTPGPTDVQPDGRTDGVGLSVWGGVGQTTPTGPICTLPDADLTTTRCSSLEGGSVADWLACWTQAQKGPGSNHSRDAVG